VYNNFKYIKKSSFEIFFKYGNRLDISDNPLNCTDIEEFVWILQQRIQLQPLLIANCRNGRNVLSLG
jgi:hypothetical protein